MPSFIDVVYIYEGGLVVKSEDSDGVGSRVRLLVREFLVNSGRYR